MFRTRRPLLTSIAVLGGVITLASTTGVFAVFSDHATTGTSTFATKDLPRAADLQIAAGVLDTHDGEAAGTPWTVACGTYADDLETGLVTVTDAVPGAGFGTDFTCVKNVGSQTVDVTTSAIDVTDLDTDCTGDEGAVDTTCGYDHQTISMPQAGELSPLVKVAVITATCNDANQGGLGAGTVATMSDHAIGTLAPNEVICVRYDINYDPTESQAQVAQSDTATWKFVFDATVPTT